jgi:hypothetical protein
MKSRLPHHRCAPPLAVRIIWSWSMKTRGIETHEPRRDTLIKEETHDPYRLRKKLSEPSVCEACNAVYANARWQWMDPVPADAEKVMCPACRRTVDNYPAGEISLSGAYLAAHKHEILNLIRNTEKQENKLYPLQRIMAIEENSDDDILIKTTGLHLPRRVGHALEHAHKGELATQYDQEGYFVRIAWSRAS